MQQDGSGPERLAGLRKKLRRRRAEGSTGSAPPPAGEPVTFRRDVPAGNGPPSPAVCGRVVPLEEVVSAPEVHPPQGPPYLLVTPRSDELATLGARLAQSFAEGCPSLAAEARGGNCRPDDLVFLDLETTGLSSSPLFLIGAVLVVEGRLELRQYLARSYAEEASIISAFAADSAECTCLVSFNGKTFDVPFLRARVAATRVTWAEPAGHVDLLHAARRVYKGVLPNCKLQTLERYVCDRRRTGDIPGGEIPEAYHEFVRTGHAARIGMILEHNALDLITLVDLFIRIA